MDGRLVNRWTPESVVAAVSFIHGQTTESPFGRTLEGRMDLRGLPLESILRPDGVTLQGVDSSGMKGGTLIFANSRLDDCLFTQSSIAWGSYASLMNRVSFAECDFNQRGMGSSGASYTNCDFTGANLSRTSNNDVSLFDCAFDNATFEDATFGKFAFTRCRFGPVIRGAIFGTREGGVFRECDFSNSAIIDCTLNRTRFEVCRFSDHSLLFTNWPEVLGEFEERVSRIDNPRLITACQMWAKVWRDCLPFASHEIIDLTDRQRQLGPEIGEEMFKIFSDIKRESAALP